MDKEVFIEVITSDGFITVLTGIIVFIISQIIMEKIVKPKDKFKQAKGKIFYCLNMYENLIFNPVKEIYGNEDYIEASKEIRRIASEFAGILEAYPIVCKKKKYNEIAKEMVTISNGLFIHNSLPKTIENNQRATNYIYKQFNAKSNKH